MKNREAVTALFISDLIDDNRSISAELVLSALHEIERFIEGKTWIRFDKSGKLVFMIVDKDYSEL